MWHSPIFAILSKWYLLETSRPWIESRRLRRLSCFPHKDVVMEDEQYLNTEFENSHEVMQQFAPIVLLWGSQAFASLTQGCPIEDVDTNKAISQKCCIQR